MSVPLSDVAPSSAELLSASPPGSWSASTGSSRVSGCRRSPSTWPSAPSNPDVELVYESGVCGAQP